MGRHVGIPGWIVDKGEDPEVVVVQLKEECGLDGEVVRLLCVKGDPKRDPRGHVISIAYVVSADGEPTAGDDASCAEWYDISQVKQMAGDHLSILESPRISSLAFGQPGSSKASVKWIPASQ